jgi:hypothetical protein
VDKIKTGDPILLVRVITMLVHRQPIRIVVPILLVRGGLLHQINRGQPGNRTRTVNRGNDHRTNQDRSILNKIADRILRDNREILLNLVRKGIIRKEIVPAVLEQEHLQVPEPMVELPDL